MKPSQHSKIIIDYREIKPLLRQALEDHQEFIPQIGYLKTGDYQIENYLLVERKTCSDFALSVVQGRLFRQAMRLSQEIRDRNILASALIVEGQEDEFHKINISREAILGAMASIQIKFYLPVFRTATPIESVKMMEIIYHQLITEQKNLSRSFPTRWGKFRKKNRKKNQIHILQGLPGIGSARAADLLNHFGSVGRVFAASLDELSQVKGIGKTTAISIRKILDP